jgi:hypothetical protein
MNVSGGKSNNQICPFLGLSDDPSTALSFPSTHNRCFHSRSATSVNLEFQRKYCLSIDHINCEEYNREPNTQRSSNSGFGSISGLWRLVNKPSFFLVILALVVVVLIVWQVLPRVISGRGPAGHLPGVTVLVDSTVVGPQTPSNLPAQVQNTPTPTLMATIVPAISTQTFTPTIGSSHALETPIGVQYKLVVHRVLAGESVMSIASQYWTTVEAIHAVNYSLQSPLLVGAIIVIPINQTDVQGLPAFDTYEVKADIPVRTLAQQLSVDPALLELYNGLGNSEILSTGDWVLVPHK